MNRELRTARVRRRSRLAWLALAAGSFLSIGTTMLSAQATTTALLATPLWTVWLQVVVNFAKVLEMAVFVFSGYQFWAGRRERKIADVKAAEQARVDSIYQAWQVMNSAQGKGGSGGRIEALRDLLRNNVSLAGINLDAAWLEGVQLSGANLSHGSLQHTNLTRANLAHANLENADLRGANLVTASLFGASLRKANLTGARLSAATLDDADLTDIVGWNEISSISYTSIQGVRHAPAGFVDFAREQGAVDAVTPTPIENDEISYSQQFRAI